MYRSLCRTQEKPSVWRARGPVVSLAAARQNGCYGGAASGRHQLSGDASASSRLRVSTVHVGQPQPRKSLSPVRIPTFRASARATGAQSLGSRGTRRRATAYRCS